MIDIMFSIIVFFNKNGKLKTEIHIVYICIYIYTYILCYRGL